jgi:hypothetical protein
MTNKQKYTEFAQKENLPIFMQPFWLDSVCEDGMEWDVILYEKGGEIWGSFVYAIKKKYSFALITMPKLTQILGPYIKYPKNQKYYKKLSWEKEVMNYFIDNLPEFDYFNMNFHYSITNWLPFYWKGFDQTTRYTYVIENSFTIEELSKNFETDIRRRRRKAEKLGVKIYESNDLKKFYELNEMTFKRQGLNIPYSYEFIKNIHYNVKQNIKILFAEYNNKIIAANCLIFDEKSVYYLMGGIHPEYKELGGMDLIQYESIKFALDNNLKYDFEGSMIESIEKYFRSFGAIQKPYFKITKINSKLFRIKNCLRNIFR